MKARVWREKPGNWRARLPGLRGTIGASTWSGAYRIAWSMTIVPPPDIVVTPVVSTCGSGACGCDRGAL